MKRTILTTMLVALTLFVFPTVSEARRGGLICGAVQMAHYGIHNARYRLAKAWLDFQHTSAQPGAVVVQTRKGRDSAGNPGAHVARIVQNTGHCRAIVSDEKGTYERDICKGLLAYVQPGTMESYHAKRQSETTRSYGRSQGRTQHTRYSAERGRRVHGSGQGWQAPIFSPPSSQGFGAQA